MTTTSRAFNRKKYPPNRVAVECDGGYMVFVDGARVVVDEAGKEILEANAASVDSLGYVVVTRGGGQSRLHRIICGGGQHTDHINRNKLDNRRANLRACSAMSNSHNRLAGKNSKTGYRGVHSRNGRYSVQYEHDWVTHSCGSFNSLDEAAMVAMTLHHAGLSRGSMAEYIQDFKKEIGISSPGRVANGCKRSVRK